MYTLMGSRGFKAYALPTSLSCFCLEGVLTKRSGLTLGQSYRKAENNLRTAIIFLSRENGRHGNQKGLRVLLNIQLTRQLTNPLMLAGKMKFILTNLVYPSTLSSAEDPMTQCLASLGRNR